MRHPWAQVGLMMVGQGASLAANMISISFSVLVGAALAPTPALATLPQALLMIATALTTAPLSALMGRFGRRAGFLAGASAGLIAAALAVGAIAARSFSLFCLSTFILGTMNAAGQYYRFAAAETVGPTRAPKAISAVLLGGILAALSVPAAVEAARARLVLADQVAAFTVAGAYAAIAFVIPWLLRFAPVERRAATAPTLGLARIFARPAFVAGMMTAAGAQALMNLMMTSTPLAMAHAGHLSHQSTQVIQAHVIAMFLPSFFSGWLVSRLGAQRMVALGLAAMLGAVATARSGLAIGHFTMALVLLGLGWNFLFVTGTAIVASSHMAAERARVQGVNEACVFGTAAVAALASGAVLALLGWRGLAAAGLALIALTAAANIHRFLRERRHPGAAGAPVPFTKSSAQRTEADR